MSINNWTILYCAGYIVPPCKGDEADTALKKIQGSSIKLDREINDYFLPLFSKSTDTCKIGISFTSTNGNQANPVRDLIRKIAFDKSEDEKTNASQRLALLLALASDHRSDTGLFIILAGISQEISRVTLFKFPADESLQATFSEQGLSLNLIKSAFSRKAEYFKAAVFEGNSASTTFWTGKVEDKQASRKGTASDLWTNGFLQSLPELTQKNGAEILARSLRKVIDETESPEVQQNLIAAVITIKSQADRNITLREFAQNYLPEEKRESFFRAVGAPILDTPFRIDADTLDKELRVRTLVLDTLFSVIGPLEGFDNDAHFSEENLDDERKRITLTGRVVSNKVKSQRSLPRK